MKRHTVFTMIIALSLLLCACVSSPDKDNSSNFQSEAKLTGKVIKIYDNSLLICCSDSEIISSDLYMISYTEDTDITAVKPGSIVEIGYDGTIMESYPAQLGNIEYIRFIKQEDDLVGLYIDIFDKLWETDKGLNYEIEIIAFDLTKSTNLSDSEKNALMYVLGDKYSLETIAGTYEELCNKGYIDEERLMFQNGILFSLEVKSESKNSFKFDAQKWRSGLGAYFFTDCTANKAIDGWTFKIGGVAIS